MRYSINENMRREKVKMIENNAVQGGNAVLERNTASKKNTASEKDIVLDKNTILEVRINSVTDDGMGVAKIKQGGRDFVIFVGRSVAK